jgi:CubicO group peptidase (beta-lactamase class C family)
VYRKGFGLASLELPVMLSAGIRMRIASITKQFTCLAYLLLCEEGKAGVDDRIGKYLPELHSVAREVTIRELMTHTSGLRDVHDIGYQFSGTAQAVSSAELLALYRDIDDINVAPGTTWSYNNGGYLLLSVAIERIAGQPLEEVLRERIFEPAGMHDTMLRRLDADFVSNNASLHMTRNIGGFEKSYLGTELTGEGGIVSTIDDMLRWLAHMDVPRVGDPTTWELMKQPQMLANGTSTGYGLGLTIDRYRGVETLSHSGSLMGGNSHMVKAPAAGLDVVVMANRHDLSSVLLANQILDACLPELEPLEKPREALPSVGVFRSPRTERVIELYANEGQQVASIDGFEYPMMLDGKDKLRPVAWLGFFKYVLTLVGNPLNPTAIRCSDFGNLDELTAAEMIDNTDAAIIVGRFRSKSTSTEVEVFNRDGQPCLAVRGRFGVAEYRLQCLTEGVWRAKSTGVMPWGGILSFDRDGSGFHFSSMRTRALKFERLV